MNILTWTIDEGILRADYGAVRFLICPRRYPSCYVAIWFVNKPGSIFQRLGDTFDTAEAAKEACENKLHRLYHN